MNKTRFLIIDDDIGICQMLSNIIEDYDLGEMVDMLMDGKEGLDKIPKYRPDIVFIDLLLPDIDGIEIVKEIKKYSHDIVFIMISQVSDPGMISDAYDVGIEFYINKPINVVEVVSVTKKVIKSQKNRRVIEKIGNTLNHGVEPTYQSKRDNSIRGKINVIFAELGIVGERGCGELINLIEMIYEDRVKSGFSSRGYQISDMYKRLSEEYKADENKKSLSDKAIEQRIRRTIQEAFMNIANIGVEDFGNFRFEKYASALFDFKEIKQTMDLIRKKSKAKGKVNIRTFVNGVLSLLEIH